MYRSIHQPAPHGSANGCPNSDPISVTDAVPITRPEPYPNSRPEPDAHTGPDCDADWKPDPGPDPVPDARSNNDTHDHHRCARDTGALARAVDAANRPPDPGAVWVPELVPDCRTDDAADAKSHGAADATANPVAEPRSHDCCTDVRTVALAVIDASIVRAVACAFHASEPSSVTGTDARHGQAHLESDRSPYTEPDPTPDASTDPNSDARTDGVADLDPIPDPNPSPNDGADYHIEAMRRSSHRLKPGSNAVWLRAQLRRVSAR